MRYEQTVGDLKAAAAAALGLTVDKLQLFWQGRELTGMYDSRTLLDMNLHTGFALQGYDLVRGVWWWWTFGYVV